MAFFNTATDRIFGPETVEMSRDWQNTYRKALSFVAFTRYCVSIKELPSHRGNKTDVWNL